MCTHPRVLNNQLISCGCCIECRKKKVNDWAVRLELERKSYGKNSLFITLTYNSDNLPNGEVLCKTDFQKFMKRLRRQADYHYGIKKIRYFMAGEYGDLFGRPHYHIILFGLSYSSDIIKLIEKSWNKGFVCVKNVTFKNCRYVAKYCVKQLAKEKQYYSEDGELIKVKEFVSMSRAGGLGYSIIKSAKWLEACRNNCLIVNRFPYSIPYSLKKKAKKVNGIVPIKQVTLLYNEEINNQLSCFCNLFRDLDINHKVDLSQCNIEIKSFKDYFSDLDLKSQKEKDYSKKRNIDYSDYYINKFKYKFFLSKKRDFTAYEYSQMKQFDKCVSDNLSYSKYYELFKSFIYENYSQLFY